MTSQPIRVLIADDHPIVRQGLTVMLAVQSDMELVAVATNGAEAVSKAAETLPDVIIMDLSMPVKDGLTAIVEIQKIHSTARILVLSSFTDNRKVFAAIKAGAMGFLLKDSEPEQLLKGIRMVYRGESMLHPTVASKLVQDMQRPSKQKSSPIKKALTARELNVLQSLGQGLSNRDIANQLTISVRTVTTHVRNILDKLNMENRTQAALYAYQEGLA